MAEIGELLTQRIEQRLNLSFVVVGELGGLFVEKFAGDGLKLNLQCGAYFLDVRKVLGCALFLFAKTLLFRDSTGLGPGAFGRQLIFNLRLEA